MKFCQRSVDKVMYKPCNGFVSYEYAVRNLLKTGLGKRFLFKQFFLSTIRGFRAIQSLNMDVLDLGQDSRNKCKMYALRTK